MCVKGFCKSGHTDTSVLVFVMYPNIFASYAIHTNHFVDIDECKSLNGGCEHICTNNNGSFFCTCLAGYVLTNDSLSCAGMLTIES